MHERLHLSHGRLFSIKNPMNLKDGCNYEQEVLAEIPQPIRTNRTSHICHFSWALPSFPRKSIKNASHRSSIIILSKATLTLKNLSIMMKLVANRLSIGMHKMWLGEYNRNKACIAWWPLTNTQIFQALFTKFLTHLSEPQSWRNKSRKSASHFWKYKWGYLWINMHPTATILLALLV